VPTHLIQHDLESKDLADVGEIFSFDTVSSGAALICDLTTKQATRKAQRGQA
jgi:hypothetical protein